MKCRFCFSFLGCVFLAFHLLAAESPTPTPTPPALVLIKAARWFDPVAGNVRENQALHIEGDKVTEIGAAADLAKGLALNISVIDLGNVTVLPGRPAAVDC